MSDNSNINMEYEARVMINEKEYEQIKKDYLKYPNQKRTITNKNLYFEVPGYYLTHNHIVLRIRHINNEKEELTLKVKGEDGDIEINYPLTKKETMELIDKNIIPSTKIIEELKARGVDINQLSIISTLFTERIEIDFPDYLFVIDKNFYNNKIDFNLEVESSNKEKANHFLKKILSHYHIEFKPDYISKSRRAILDL